MLEWMTGSHIGNLLSTFLISMAPVVELRGGIPWGVAHDLPLWEAYITAVLGNMVPVPFVMLFMRKLLLWLHHFEKIGELADRIEARIPEHGLHRGFIVDVGRQGLEVVHLRHLVLDGDCQVRFVLHQHFYHVVHDVNTSYDWM